MRFSKHTWFLTAVLMILAAFIQPLGLLIRHTLHSSLESHLMLVPFISLYLLHVAQKKHGQAALPRIPAYFTAVILAIVSSTSLVAGRMLTSDTARILTRGDQLSFQIFALITAFIAITAWIWGAGALRRYVFPLLFLYFMVPLPPVLIAWFQELLQKWSADATEWLLIAVSATYLRDGQFFTFPGLTIEVAEECSGIHSTYVLLITSLLAGHLMLRTLWRRALLTLAIVPLGVLRNGFRVVLIALLTLKVNPNVINSPLHRRGGPLFFILSLAVLLGLLLILRRSEKASDEPRAN